MREMKDSGIEWIGSVPRVWIKKKIKNAVSYIGSGTTPPSHDLLYYDGGIFWIQSGDIYGKNLICDTFVTLTDTAVHTIPALRMYEHDFIVIAMYGGSVGNIAISKIDACTNQACCVIKPDENNDMQFMYYWMLICRDDFLKSAIGGGQPNISQAKIRNQYYFQPSLSEQHLIASFLDTKCAEIDALTTDIQMQIDTLEQYKRSVITEAVTKGLNPDAGMKDSGIEWIGSIPAHWTFARIGGLYGLRIEKVSDNDFEPLSVTKLGVVPQLETAAKTNAHDDRKLVREGDFVINSRSDRRGSCGISNYDGSVSLINTVLYPLADMNPQYYNWLFHTTEFADEFYRWGHGIVDDLWTTGWQDMKNIVIISPPMNEQKAIADYLDIKCAEIDEIITQKREQLATIEEYKKSLIFEYVTGKKEVRSDDESVK